MLHFSQMCSIKPLAKSKWNRPAGITLYRHQNRMVLTLAHLFGRQEAPPLAMECDRLPWSEADCDELLFKNGLPGMRRRRCASEMLLT